MGIFSWDDLWKFGVINIWSFMLVLVDYVGIISGGNVMGMDIGEVILIFGCFF